MRITNDDFWEIIKYNYDQIQFCRNQIECGRFRL